VGAAWAATPVGAEQDFVQRANAERQAAGLPGLQIDVELVRVARTWSDKMAAEGRLYHNPDLANAVKADWTRLGENVGTATHSTATIEEHVERIHQAFMNSPAHRDNMLGDWAYVGVGVRMDGGTMWVTVNFMKAPSGAEGSGEVNESISVSRQVFGSERQADYVVLGRADVFADALGGAALAGDRGPILFTPGPRPHDPDPVLDPRTRLEIDRALNGSGTVYLLGGESAVSKRAAGELGGAGYSVRRLAGPSRIETSVRVAEEVLLRRGRTGEVLIARADTWGDAVSGGAYAAFTGSPVLLTNSGSLHPEVARFLTTSGATTRWALGGQAALSDVTVTAAGATRVSGSDRAGTAVAVAEQLWKRTHGQVGDRFVSVPGFSDSGWAYALAYAPWSASLHGPQLLVGNSVPPAVQDYLRRLGYSSVTKGTVDAATVVPVPVVQELRQLVGD
jgi:hypothetical protein